MINLFIVGCGGFLGAIARHTLTESVQKFHGGIFPFGTMAVNVLGCLFFGISIALIEELSLISPNFRLFIMVGLLGSLTTFSTFSYESMVLIRDGELIGAAFSMIGNLMIGFGALLFGRFIFKAIGA